MKPEQQARQIIDAQLAAGFGRSSLFQIRAFCPAYQEKVQTVSGQLSPAYFESFKKVLSLPCPSADFNQKSESKIMKTIASLCALAVLLAGCGQSDHSKLVPALTNVPIEGAFGWKLGDKISPGGLDKCRGAGVECRVPGAGVVPVSVLTFDTGLRLWQRN